MRRREFLHTGLAAGTLAIAGCMGGTPSEAADGTPDAAGGDRTVTLEDSSFQPRTVRTETGSTITWSNEGSANHTVNAATLTDSGAEWSFTSGTLEPGQTATRTFDEVGAFEYYCMVHGKATMCGVVIVGDATHSAELPCASDDDIGGY